MHVYAVVSISGGDKKSIQKTKTPVDHDGDANPTWNFPMKFTVEEGALQLNRLTLDFKLVCERALGDKDIGEVHVPIKELLGSTAAGKQFVSYQVRKPSGKPKGQVNFSYHFGEKTAAAAPLLPVVNGKYDGVPSYRTQFGIPTSAGRIRAALRGRGGSRRTIFTTHRLPTCWWCSPTGSVSSSRIWVPTSTAGVWISTSASRVWVPTASAGVWISTSASSVWISTATPRVWISTTSSTTGKEEYIWSGIRDWIVGRCLWWIIDWRYDF